MFLVSDLGDVFAFQYEQTLADHDGTLGTPQVRRYMSVNSSHMSAHICAHLISSSPENFFKPCRAMQGPCRNACYFEAKRRLGEDGTLRYIGIHIEGVPKDAPDTSAATAKLGAVALSRPSKTKSPVKAFRG